jgi:hypothetical protein
LAANVVGQLKPVPAGSENLATVLEGISKLNFT